MRLLVSLSWNKLKNEFGTNSGKTTKLISNQLTKNYILHYRDLKMSSKT